MAHSPPPYLTGQHRILLEALMVGLFLSASSTGKPGFAEERARILAILQPELEVLNHASDPEASVGQLLAAFYHVCETMAWSHDRNELPF